MYRHSCKECGEDFYSDELLDSFCQECMSNLGFHGIDDDSSFGLVENEFDEENPYGYR